MGVEDWPVMCVLFGFRVCTMEMCGVEDCPVMCVLFGFRVCTMDMCGVEDWPVMCALWVQGLHNGCVWGGRCILKFDCQALLNRMFLNSHEILVRIHYCPKASVENSSALWAILCLSYKSKLCTIYRECMTGN